MMDTPEDNFLPTMIGILDRLHEKSTERNAGMLAFLIDLARSEAQDQLKAERSHGNVRTALLNAGAATTAPSASTKTRPAIRWN